MATEQQGVMSFAELDSLYKNMIVGNTDKRYKIVACVIRNTGSGFELIDDSSHTPIGVTSVTNDTNEITINYDFTASKVGTLIVGCDEIMVANGMSAGASVGLALSKITAYKSYFVNGYITKSGGGIPSYVVNASLSKGVQSATAFDSLTMEVNHDLYDLPNFTTGEAYAKSGDMNAYISSHGLSTTRVKFKNDFVGVDVIPNDGVYLFEKAGVSKMNPNDLTYTGSNFWIYGIFEV